MTEQTFHITGLVPGSAICGRGGRIWSASQWPGDDDMRSGCFVRCKDCDRLLTPALQTAISKGRELKHAMLAACETGWREGCSQSTSENETERTAVHELLRECENLGRRAGADAKRLARDAQSGSGHPASPEPEDAAVTAGAAR